MMKRHFPVCYLLVLFVAWAKGNVCPAQITKATFDHLTTSNGLLSDRIRCIFRDSKDYLWMGTDIGLDKYDSYQVKKYRTDRGLPGEISSNIITCIYEDRKKNLWIGTGDGLNLYVSAVDSFVSYRNSHRDKHSLNSNSITGIVEDKKGNLWVVSDGSCLNKWVSGSRKFVRYPFDNRKESIGPPTSKTIAMDSKGRFWMPSTNKGLYCFDPESEEYTFYDDSVKKEVSTIGYKSIYIDAQDKIWIASNGDGFFSYDPARGTFEHFGSKGDGKGTNRAIIHDIIPENDRYLLLAVDQGGINRFDKVSKTFEYLLYDPGMEMGINNNGIWCFHRDREGILWVGTSGGGINYWNPKKDKFKLFKQNKNNLNSLSYNFTGCFCEDDQGMIWIGTDGGGINVYNPRTGRFKIYKNIPSDPYSVSGDVIRSIVEDRNHDMWIGTWDAGLNRFDRKTGKFIRYMPDVNNRSSISGRTVWNIRMDRDGILWLGVYNKGIDLFDTKKGVIRRFCYDPNKPGSLSSNICWFFFEDNRNRMWVCTENGLNWYDSKTNTFRVCRFPDDNIGAFLQDKSGNIWVGSKTHGLFLCDQQGVIRKSYGMKEGLPSDRIHAILDDSHGNLWISTNYGICRFNPKTGQFRSFTKEDGLQGNQFFQQSFLKTRRGEFFFGGFEGFNSFFPDSLRENDFVPPVYITDFQIFNKPVSYGGLKGQFQTQISEAKEVVLRWDQSVFSFSFAAINYTNPEKNQYAYFMEGFEKGWNYTNANRRYVTYTNLNPGEYVFHVKASNNDGVWNEKGVALKVVILPPWWKTIWFRIAVLLVFLSSIYGVFYLRTALYRNKQKELSKLVEERTKEITHANQVLLERQTYIEEQAEELRVHSNHLNEANNLLVQKQNLIKLQSDKIQDANNELVKLNSTKDKILSIIAHDLRNPFNVISGFSEILVEDMDSLPLSEVKEYLNMIRSSSKNGTVLLENLLQWSRNQTGRIPFEPVAVCLLDVVREVCGYLEGDALKKEIGIQVQVDSNVMVRVDVKMLETILRNLLSNAIKFTHEKGTVTISSFVSEGFAEVSVCDTGVGIPQERIPLLFHIETNRSTKGTALESGSGLGLILCKEFVDMHRGKIWVESEPGHGTCFKFTLPLV